MRGRACDARRAPKGNVPQDKGKDNMGIQADNRNHYFTIPAKFFKRCGSNWRQNKRHARNNSPMRRPRNRPAKNKLAISNTMPKTPIALAKNAPSAMRPISA